MNRNQVAAKVAKNKEAHPEFYCPSPRCLWHTGGGYCPRHAHSDYKGELAMFKKEPRYD